MKRTPSIASLLVGLVAAAALAACDDDDNDGNGGNGASNSIVDVAVADGSFTGLVAALQQTGLDSTLSGDGPFTVFAPTDEAFGRLPIDPLSLDATTLSNLLTYHVVSGSVLAADVVNLTSATTEEGSDIAIQVRGSEVWLDGVVLVTTTDIQAGNGVIHVIDSVLFPESIPFPGNMVERLLAHPAFDSLAGAAVDAGLDDDIAGLTAGTLFAPNGAAFDALTTVPTGTELEETLLYHAIGSELMASDVTSSLTVDTLLGGPVLFDTSTGVMINEANIIYTDVSANNGVIHVIDAVLALPDDIVTIAAATPALSTLVTALGDAALAEELAALGANGSFTVFAPTNDAFTKLSDVTGGLPSGTALERVVQYHVAAGNIDSATAVAAAGSSVDSIAYETTNDNTTPLLPIDVRLIDGGVVLNGHVPVATTDIIAKNGIVHLVDAVLLPPSTADRRDGFEALGLNVVQAAQTSLLFDTLVAKVVEADASGLLGLGGAGPFTLFAPTEGAFAALTNVPTGQDLVDTLSYHVVGAEALAADVVTLTTARTLLNGGAPANVSTDDGVFLNEAEVVYTDLETSNGVIHVLDDVVDLPGNIIEVAGAAGFTQLAGALTGAGLTSTFEGTDLFTVFAPTDDAFTALSDAITLPGDLTQILLYHAVPGVIDSADATGALGGSVPSLVNGAGLDPEFDLNLINGGIMIDGRVQITATDIVAENGIIHIIDAVMTPEDDTGGADFPGTIVDMVIASPSYSTLLTAVLAADAAVAMTLDGAGTFTLFAPTNEAFAAVPDLATIIADQPLLTNILLYHALGAEVPAASVTSGVVTTLLDAAGDPTTYDADVTIDASNGVVLDPDTAAMGDEATVIYTDIFTTNGVVHIIDAVLVPTVN